MADLWPGRPNFKLEGPDLRPDGPDLRLDGPDGGDEQTNGRTNKSTPVFYRTLSPSGLLPKNG